MFSVSTRRSKELSGGPPNKENTVIFCLFFPVLRVIPSIRACLAWFLWSFVWNLCAEGLEDGDFECANHFSIGCMWLETSRTSVFMYAGSHVKTLRLIWDLRCIGERILSFRGKGLPNLGHNLWKLFSWSSPHSVWCDICLSLISGVSGL